MRLDDCKNLFRDRTLRVEMSVESQVDGRQAHLCLTIGETFRQNQVRFLHVVQHGDAC